MHKPTSIHLVGTCVHCCWNIERHCGKYYRWLRYNPNSESDCNTVVDGYKNPFDMHESIAIHLAGSYVHWSIYHHRHRRKYHRWLRYNPDIDIVSESITDRSKRSFNLCKPTSIYLVWSCVHGCRNSERYCGKYYWWLRYNQDTQPDCNTIVDRYENTRNMHKPTSIHMVWSCVHGSIYHHGHSDKYHGWL